MRHCLASPERLAKSGCVRQKIEATWEVEMLVGHLKVRTRGATERWIKPQSGRDFERIARP